MADDENRYKQMQQAHYSDKQDAEVTKFLLQADAIVQKKILYYKGYVWDSLQNKFVKSSLERPLNKEGVEFVERQFYTFLNKNTVMSDLSEEKVSILALEFSSRIRRNLFRNIKKYAIKDVASLDEIKNDLSDMAYMVLTQCIDGKGRKFTYQPLKVSQSVGITESASDKNKLKLGF